MNGLTAGNRWLMVFIKIEGRKGLLVEYIPTTWEEKERGVRVRND